MVTEIGSVDTGDAIAHCCQFDKTGKQLLVGSSDAEIKMINLETNELTASIKGHENSVNDLVINQENDTVYTAGGDGIVKVWK